MQLAQQPQHHLVLARAGLIRLCGYDQLPPCTASPLLDMLLAHANPCYS